VSKIPDRFSGPSAQAELLKQAWIGDAVLALWARLRILREDGRLDGGKCTRMTSNQFLSAMGEPTKVEAGIGAIYLRNGLEAAFQYMDQHLLPLFERQEINRVVKSSRKKT
jgi:dsRNA-specific ribonuclease